MTKTIYEKHDAAFNNVAAWAILENGVHLANVTVKFPRDGAGRLTMFVHVIGTPMVAGTATRYGYDKQSAAARNAWEKLPRDYKPTETESRFWEVMSEDSGHRWHNALMTAGFTVIQVI